MMSCVGRPEGELIRKGVDGLMEIREIFVCKDCRMWILDVEIAVMHKLLGHDVERGEYQVWRNEQDEIIYDGRPTEEYLVLEDNF